MKQKVHANKVIANSNKPLSKSHAQLKSQKAPGSGIGFAIQKKENKTGMPSQLKSGLEHMSGMDLSDVRVHRNSSLPAQLNAHAYAQGNQIHLAAGQEKHLPHEGWHVVQQKQGRVKPTKQLKPSIGINDNPALEKEADLMGAKAAQRAAKKSAQSAPVLRTASAMQNSNGVIQNKTEVKGKTQEIAYKPKPAKNKDIGDFVKNTPNVKEQVGQQVTAILDPYEPIKGYPAQSGSEPLYKSLQYFWRPGSKNWVRGHLLNADLGGINDAFNLFPITGHANGDHLTHVETIVKQWLIDKKTVKYTVDAKILPDVSGAAENVPSAQGSFECTAETIVDPVIDTSPSKDPKDSKKVGKTKIAKVEKLHVTIKSTPRFLPQNARGDDFSSVETHSDHDLEKDKPKEPKKGTKKNSLNTMGYGEVSELTESFIPKLSKTDYYGLIKNLKDSTYAIDWEKLSKKYGLKRTDGKTDDTPLLTTKSDKKREREKETPKKEDAKKLKKEVEKDDKKPVKKIEAPKKVDIPIGKSAPKSVKKPEKKSVKKVVKKKK